MWWRIWWIAVGLIIPFTLTGIPLWLNHARQTAPMAGDAPFSGSLQIVLIALVLALSGYLRQVYSHTLDLRDKVRVGELKNYPLSQEHTKKRVAALENNALYLKAASPFLLLLGLGLSARLVVETIGRVLKWGQNGFLFWIADVIFAEWLGLLLLGLIVVHLIARVRDDKIRAEAKVYEEREFPYTYAKAKAAAAAGDGSEDSGS